MKHNFGAGPSTLPREVLKQAADAVLDLNGSHLSILEISHRSSAFQAILEECTSLVKELLNIPAGYSVLFLHGGASLQFVMVPMNLLRVGSSAAYLDTGVWASKAIKEAKVFGDVYVVASSKEGNYSYIPSSYSIPHDADYVHLTSNNTIYGTEFYNFPKSPVPIVADMSSDILSRPIDVSCFALIYAGAQKNLGPAGVTLVILRDEILGKAGRKIPTMLDYQVQIAAGSVYNTPPVFAIYVSLLTLRWLKAKGGLIAIEKENIAKATALYAEIDRNILFKGTCRIEDRSRMNVCFVMENPSLEDPFLAFAQERDIIGIKGHRSVGGFRASLYNALPIESVNVLVEAMRDFERQVI